MALGLAVAMPAWAQPTGGGAAPADQPPKPGLPAPASAAPAPESEPPAPPSEVPAPGSEAPAPGSEAAPAPADNGLPAWGPAPGKEPTPGTTQTPQAPTWDSAAGPNATTSFPWFENHGYFRFRADMFHNLDLDTYSSRLGYGTSPFLPPLTELGGGSGHPEDPTHTYKRGAETVSDANIRFRYQPTIHITEALRIRSIMDILDNLVLGSTPDGGTFGEAAFRPDVPLSTFSGGQRPPESGVNGFRDSVRVKAVWGEWKTPIGLLALGRQPSNWGLGILANSGNCLDCDFGDYVDRVMGVTQLFGTYVALAWDFPGEGDVGFSGSGFQNAYNQPFGQMHDLDQLDDVNEWVIALFRRPMSQEEKEIRARALNDERKVVWDWGVYNVIRNQALTSYRGDTGTDPQPDPTTNTQLRDVKAFAYIPDLWLNFQWNPRRDHEIRLAFEGAGVWGVIDEVPALASRAKTECTDPSVPLDECPSSEKVNPRKREVKQWGYALEYDHRINKLSWGLRQGAASGDSTDGFGVLDKNPLDTSGGGVDKSVTNFKFDRDYILDLILFREIIGTVTNAVYFQPYISYDLVRDDRDAWGFKFSPEYAFALEKSATPGNQSPLGLEFDLTLYIKEFDRFEWNVQYGILFPFGAFDLLDPNNPGGKPLAEPGIAQTLQTNFYFTF
jgi:uncharacterized protein (TIGR04551 family)